MARLSKSSGNHSERDFDHHAELSDFGTEEELHLSEKLSAWIDEEDELTEEQIDQLLADDALRKRWGNFHLISHGLREYAEASQTIDRSMDTGKPWVPMNWHLFTHQPAYIRQMATVAFAFLLVGVIWQFWPVIEDPENMTRDLSTVVASSEGDSENDKEASVGGQAATNVSVNPDLRQYLVHHSAYLADVGAQGSIPQARLISLTE